MLIKQETYNICRASSSVSDVCHW